MAHKEMKGTTEWECNVFDQTKHPGEMLGWIWLVRLAAAHRATIAEEAPPQASALA